MKSMSILLVHAQASKWCPMNARSLSQKMIWLTTT
jgi:hypothetical protein